MITKKIVKFLIIFKYITCFKKKLTFWKRTYVSSLKIKNYANYWNTRSMLTKVNICLEVVLLHLLFNNVLKGPISAYKNQQ